jgi:type IV pilus assembly protein PilF
MDGRGASTGQRRRRDAQQIHPQALGSVLALSLLLCTFLLGGCQSLPGPAARPSLARSEEGDSMAVLNTQLGIEYFRQGNFETALMRLERAVQIDRDYGPAHDALGLLYARLGQKEDADRHFRRSVELQPNGSGALNNYGQFLCAQGRTPEGLALFDRAIANPLYANPENAHTNAGLCLLAAGDVPAAAARFEEALKSNPRMPPALLQLCRIHFEQGDHLRARAYLQRYSGVAEPTAEALWLGVRIERALGDRDAEFAYAVSLRNNFPDSPEAMRLATEGGGR